MVASLKGLSNGVHLIRLPTSSGGAQKQLHDNCLIIWSGFMVIWAPEIRRSTIINLDKPFQSHDSAFIENVIVINPLLLQIALMRTIFSKQGSKTCGFPHLRGKTRRRRANIMHWRSASVSSVAPMVRVCCLGVPSTQLLPSRWMWPVPLAQRKRVGECWTLENGELYVYP